MFIPLKNRNHPQIIGRLMGESPYSFPSVALKLLAETAYFLFINF